MSDYIRTKITDPYFNEIFKGMKIYKIPDLPMIECKFKKYKISVTDLRLLHPLGLECIQCCLNTMINYKDAKTCRVAKEKDSIIDDTETEIMADIALGLTYRISRLGPKGFVSSGCVVTGVDKEIQDNRVTALVFHLNTEFSKSTYEYVKSHKGEKITIIDLIAYHAELEHMKFIERYKKYKRRYEEQ